MARLAATAIGYFIVFLLGAIVGIGLIIVRGRDKNIPIPFGPYLAGAGWIALLWGEQIMHYYLQLSA